MGKIFDNPRAVFTEDMLKPELQDMDMFVDGVDNLVGAYQRSALNYFEDGSIEFACPPIKALLNIMAYGHYEGKSLTDPEVRNLFTRESVMSSDWYQQRFEEKQSRDVERCKRNVESLETFTSCEAHAGVAQAMDIQGRLTWAKEELEKVSKADYVKSLVGTIGADPID